MAITTSGQPTGALFTQSVVAGTNVTVDNSDPANPVVSSTASGGSPVGLNQTLNITPSATMNTNGTAAVLAHASGKTSFQPIMATVAVANKGAETVTVTVTGTFSDTSTQSLTPLAVGISNFDEIGIEGSGGYSFDADLSPLIKNGLALTGLSAVCQSTIDASTATVAVAVFGSQF